MTLPTGFWSQTIAAAAAALALSALIDGAAAQLSSAQQSALRSNCRSDFMAKCSGVTPGSADALACLQKNVAGLSPACKTAVSATMPPPAAQAAPAPPPAPAHTQPTIVSAPPPKAALPARPVQPAAPVNIEPAVAANPPPAPTPQQMSAIKNTCSREFKVHCRGVPPGGPEALACLKLNQAKLNANCRTSLAALGDAIPAAPPPGAPPQAAMPQRPVVMTAVIGRACLRDLIRHCREVKVGDGQKMACLMAHADRLTVVCKAAMKITKPLQ